MGSLNRVTCSEKIESAWTSMLAAQASSKDMKKWTKRWEDAAAPSGSAKSQNDLGRFLTKYGGGF